MDKRELQYVYNAGDAQAPIYLDDFSHQSRGVQLEPIVTGVGYVQATVSTRKDIEDGHAAWVTWPAGSISAVSQDTLDPSATAIRVYRTSGDLKVTVRLV